MRYLVIVLLLTAVTSYSQIFEPFPKGLSVELSANYPALSWGVNEGGVVGNGDRKELWIKPNLKIAYSLRIYKGFSVKPFAGYLSFGGRSDEKPNGFGYKDKIVINAIEAGAFFLYKINNLELGVGSKWNNNLSVTQHHYGYFGSYPSTREWEEENFDYFFNKTSFDWGVRASYLLIYKINVFAEYWSSLQDIESKNLSEFVNIRNRTIKLGAGFNF